MQNVTTMVRNTTLVIPSTQLMDVTHGEQYEFSISSVVAHSTTHIIPGPSISPKNSLTNNQGLMYYIHIHAINVSFSVAPAQETAR